MARTLIRTLIRISTLLSLLACYRITTAQVQLIPSAEVEVVIPVAPTPVKSNGQTHLAYELHVTNFNSRDTTLKRIEVFAQENSTTPLTIYQDTALTNLLARPGARSNLADKRVIGGGMRAVVYLWLTVNADNPVPTSLRHRLFFESTSATGKVEEEVMDGAQIIVRKGLPLVIGSPLRGGNWIAGNGPSNNSRHRRALLALNGRVTISQRFAYDFMRLGEDGKALRGDPSRNENWHGYGAEVLAVADGMVLETQDGVPENTPLTPKRPVPIPSAKTVGGNYVIINMGEHLFAFYAHMQPKSIRVKTGDRVKRGQILGLLGNSGNSDAPHLHFHISDGQSLSDSEGLPFVFESFDILGETILLEALGLESKGNSWKPRSNATPIKRQKEMPLDNAVVRFP